MTGRPCVQRGHCVQRRPLAWVQLRVLLAAGLAWAAALSPAGPPRLGAQSSARVLESVLLPPRFFVGDRVELRLRLAVPAGAPVAAPGLEELPETGPPLAEGDSPAGGRSGSRGGASGGSPSWARIDRIEVDDRRQADQAGEVRVRVFFTPFAPGKGTLPVLDLGGVRVPSQEFSAVSVRDREPDPGFRPLRGQLLLPLARLRLVLAVLVLIGAPTALVLAGLWVLRLLRRLRDLHRRRRPAHRARGALHKLEQDLAESETRKLFVDLSQVLKRYLAERLGLPTSSATTAEVEGLLEGVGVARVLSERVQEVLRAADTAKFSGHAGRRSAARSSLRKVREIVNGVEELCNVEP